MFIIKYNSLGSVYSTLHHTSNPLQTPTDAHLSRTCVTSPLFSGSLLMKRNWTLRSDGSSLIRANQVRGVCVILMRNRLILSHCWKRLPALLNKSNSDMKRKHTVLPLLFLHLILMNYTWGSCLIGDWLSGSHYKINCVDVRRVSKQTGDTKALWIGFKHTGQAF